MARRRPGVVAVLILAQVDDRSGEVLGRALGELLDLGAHNAQLLASHTKKGRPGTILLVDLEEEVEAAVAGYLAVELGVWGYHVLESRHRHFETTMDERRVTVACGALTRTFTLPCKSFRHGGELVRVKVERDDVEAVTRLVRSVDPACSSDTVRLRLEHELRRHPGSSGLRVEF